MLKKELCKKCWNTYAESFDTEDIKSLLRWSESDEQCWKEEEVYCPRPYKEFNTRRTTGKPPANCPFYLEQVI